MNRIKELRDRDNISLKELTLELNKKGLKINDGQLSKYERENQTPRNKDFWKVIADYFNVSEAYLLGYYEYDSSIQNFEAVADYLSNLSELDYKKMIEIVERRKEEQLDLKYFVRLKQITVNVRGYRDDEYYISGANFYLDVLKEFSPDGLKYAFTKSELAEIMDGALYKRSPYGEICETGSRTGWYHVEDDDSWDDEWINPLIELVLVEEE